MNNSHSLSRHDLQQFKTKLATLKTQLTKSNKSSVSPNKSDGQVLLDLNRIKDMNKSLDLMLVNVEDKSGKRIINQGFERLKEKLENSTERSKVDVEGWVGELMRVAIEEAYKVYSEDGDEMKMRVGFASFILEQKRKFTIELSKMKDVEEFDFEESFKKISNLTLEYLQYQFEASKGNSIDITLPKIIKQTGKYVDTEYDLLKRSGTDLDLNQPKSIRYSIKTFLNKLINECHQKQEMFKQFVDKVFRVDGDTAMDKEFGSKIKMSTPPYTSQEIRSNGFFVPGNEIMRVMMKWIQELLHILKSPSRILYDKGKFRISHEQEMEVLSFSEKEVLWGQINKHYDVFKEKKEQLKDRIQDITTKIMLASQHNTLVREHKISDSKEDIQKFDYLDQNALNMLIISEHIWVALQSYMMDTLVQILCIFKNISNQRKKQDENIKDLQIHTFMLGDMFRCRGHGTKEQVIRVWENMKEQEQQGRIKILRVKNRLESATSDFLINFAFQDPKECFLICEMQLGLKRGKDKEIQKYHRTYHFMHFLYEMARSDHGVIIELAIMLYYLDSRKQFIRKNKIKRTISSNSSYPANHEIEKSKQFDRFNKVSEEWEKSNSVGNDRTYMCDNCKEVIPAFKYQFNPLEDGEETLCPACYLNLMNFNLASAVLLTDSKEIQKYFKPIELRFGNRKQQQILDAIKKCSKDKVLIVSWRNSSDAKRVEVIEKVQKAGQSYYINSFSNELFNAGELTQSILLILDPINNPETKSMNSLCAEREEKSSVMDMIDKRINKRKYKYYQLTNPTDDKFMVIGHHVEAGLEDIERNISDQKMKEIVDRINRGYEFNTKLLLINIQNFEGLENIKFKDRIIDIEIEEAYVGEKKQQYKFDFLKLFHKVACISIYKTPFYRVHGSYPFDSTIQELTIKNCNLTSFPMVEYSYPLLEKLDLSHNNLEQVPPLKLKQIELINLSFNEIKSIASISKDLLKLRRIIIKHNRIKHLHPLSLPSLQILNLKQNSIQSFQNIPKFNTPNLKRMDLSHNNQKQKILSKIDNLPNLNTLDVTRCNINSTQVLTSSKLKVLKLAQNNLTSASNLTNINFQLLDLSFNKIDDDALTHICLHISADVIQLYQNNFFEFDPHCNPKPIMAIIETSQLALEMKRCETETTVMARKRKTYSNYRPSLCHYCYQEIKELYLLYDKIHHYKLCLKHKSPEEQMRSDDIMELVKVFNSQIQDTLM